MSVLLHKNYSLNQNDNMRKIFIFNSLFCILLLVISCSSSNVLDNTNSTFSITLDQDSVTISPTDTLTLKATVKPNNSKSINWTSSNKNVATVFYGMVIAKGIGSTTITASIGTDSAKCIVTVAQAGYQLVWSDEFNGTSLDPTNWNIETGTGNGGWGNNEAEYYTGRSSNLRVENGHLIIQALKEDYNGSSYTSARITTKKKQDFAYGKVEARISLPSGAGTWPAFWMLGYGTWPSCGEIDIMEHIGSQPTMISHALHTQTKYGGNCWSSRNYKDNIEGNFHTYGIEWEQKAYQNRDCIRFYVDGELTATCWDPVTTEDKSQWPFTSNFYIILNLALGGTMGGTIDNSIFNNNVIMEVDWVRVYQRK